MGGKGKLGKDLTVEQGESARQAGLIMLTKIRTALAASIGSSAWSRCLAWSTPPSFGDQPLVVNGFSDLMVEVFGEAGKHARSAVAWRAFPQLADRGGDDCGIRVSGRRQLDRHARPPD